MRSVASLIASSSCALAFLCTSLTANASPQDLFAYGPRSQAMGGLGATFVDDYAAVHANPAGLSRARVRSFSLGYLGASFGLWTAVGANAHTPLHADLARATTIGLTLPLPFGGVLRDRIAIGLGFYTPTAVVVRGRILRPEQPQFLLVPDRTQSVALQLGLGVDVGYGLRLGVGFAALAAIVGSVLIAQDSTGRVGSRVDDQLVASYALVAGASFDRGPFRIAATFRDALVGRFGVTIQARDIGLPLPSFDIAGIAQYDPRQVAIEAGYARGPWLFALGTTFKQWSEYPGPLVATTASSKPPPAPGFQDTWVLRAGAEFHIDWLRSRFAARAGYFYEPTPVPLAQSISNYLDNDRHVITAGLALSGRARGTTLGVETFAQLHVLADRTSVKSREVAEENPGYPSITSGGTVFVFGLAATVTF
jgi:long-chain fatty acid transport protein